MNNENTKIKNFLIELGTYLGKKWSDYEYLENIGKGVFTNGYTMIFDKDSIRLYEPVYDRCFDSTIDVIETFERDYKPRYIIPCREGLSNTLKREKDFLCNLMLPMACE